MDESLTEGVDGPKVLCEYVRRSRIWFSGRTTPCQGVNRGSIPRIRTENLFVFKSMHAYYA